MYVRRAVCVTWMPSLRAGQAGQAGQAGVGEVLLVHARGWSVSAGRPGPGLPVRTRRGKYT